MTQTKLESAPIPALRDARIAAVQMISSASVADNLACAAELVAQAVAQGAELVALPEYFPLMGLTDQDKIRCCEPDLTEAEAGEAERLTQSTPIQKFLIETAKKHQIFLIGGSIPLRASVPEKVRNACVVYNPQGERVARYDKIHLFGFQKGSERYNESETIEAGRQPVVFTTPFARVGLSICYDLRFPELYRAMGVNDLLVIPAAFTETTGRAHWEILLRARAIENQCYVLAVGQGGRHQNGRETHGNSMLIDPWGTIIGRQDKGAGIVLGTLEHSRIAEVRTSLPALQHRVIA
ncbi:MAG: carbon-nitrogen hydrolase family protein [Pseudomonadota bacterium]